MPVEQPKEPEMTAPKDYTAYSTKAPTATHEFYAGWLREHTGVEVEVKAVQLAVNLYADFQKSPEWIAKRDELKAAADAAKLAATAGKKPGATKAQREAKKIADALEALKAAGIDTSGLAVKVPVASATELPGNPVVEAGAVVETPADPEPIAEESSPELTPAEIEQQQVKEANAALQAPKPRSARKSAERGVRAAKVQA